MYLFFVVLVGRELPFGVRASRAEPRAKRKVSNYANNEYFGECIFQFDILKSINAQNYEKYSFELYPK